MPFHWAAWDQTARENGLELTLERLLSLAGKPSAAIMQLLCTEQGKLDVVDMEAAVRRKQELYVELAVASKPIEIVFNVAKAAKSRGLPVAVATGGTKKQVTASLTASGLSDFFDAVVTCDVSSGQKVFLSSVFYFYRHCSWMLFVSMYLP
jgi:beta-phosphoglucomutase-like phosphatase (HAD superfamily)